MIGLIIGQNVNNLDNSLLYSQLLKEKNEKDSNQSEKIFDNNASSPSIINNAGHVQGDAVIGSGVSLKTTEASNLTNSIKTIYGENDSTFYGVQTGNNINITVSPLSTPNYKLMNNTLEIIAYRPEVNVVFSNDTSKTSTLQDNTAAQAVKLENITDSISAIITSFEIELGSLRPQVEEIYGEIWSAVLNSDGSIIPGSKMANTSALTDGDTSATNQDILLTFDKPVIITTKDTYYNATLKEAYIFFVFYSNNTDSQFSYYRTDTTTTDTDKAPTYTKTSTTNWTLEWNDVWLNFDYGYIFLSDVLDTRVYFNEENITVGVLSNNKVIDNTTKSYEKYTIIYNTSKAWPNTKFNITLYRFSFNQTLGNSLYIAKSYLPEVKWNVSTSFNVVFSGNGRRFISLPKNFTVISVFLNGTQLSPGTDFDITGDVWGNKSVLLFTGNGDYLILANSSNLLWKQQINTYKRSQSEWVLTSQFVMGTLYPTKEAGDYLKANISSELAAQFKNGSYNATLFDPNGKILGNQSILPDYVDHYNNTYLRDFNGTLTFITAFDPNQTTGTWTFQFYWTNGTAVGIGTVNITVIPSISMYIEPMEGTNYLENSTINIIIATLDKSHNSDWPGNSPGSIKWKFENKTLVRDGTYNATHYKYTTSLNTSINAFPITPGRYNITIIFTDNIFNYTWETYFNLYYRASSSVVGDNEIYYGDKAINVLVTPWNVTGGGKILNSSSLLFDVPEAPFNATYIPSTGKYNITIWNNGFQTGIKTLNIRWQYDGYRNDPNSAWIVNEYNILVKPRPIIITISNNALNNSDVLYQEKYSTKIFIRDGLNNSYLTIGTLLYTSNASENINIQQTSEYNGSYQEIISIVKPDKVNAIIEWTFNENGYETTKLMIVVHIKPRPLEFLVLTPSSVNASGKSDPISVLINDGVNNSVIDIETEIEQGRLQILTDTAQYNGTGTWESEIYKQWIIIYFILTEDDAGKNITLILTVQLYGYETTDLVITLHVNPLVPTTVFYQSPEETHYFQETRILLNYMSNNTSVKNYEVKIQAPDSVIYNLTINQNTGERTVIFRVIGEVPNNNLTIIITLTKEGYTTQTLTFNIRVLPAKVDINYQTPTNVHVSNESIDIPITLTAYGWNVSGSLSIINWNCTITPSVSPDTVSNQFIITVYLVNQDAAHTITIFVTVNSTILYGNNTIIFNVADLEKINISYEITGQIAPGEIFSVVLTASQGTQSLLLLSLNQAGTNIDYTKLTANVTIVIKLANGTIIKLFDTEAFNSEGKSILGPFLIPTEAVDLKLSINVAGLGVEPVVLNPDIKLQDNNQLDLQSLLTFKNLMYLLGTLITILLASFIAYYLVKRKEEKRRQKNLALQIIGEVSNARALIIVDRRTGYSIYTFKFQDIAIDPQLIAGILHAYGAFDQEMTGDFAVDVPPGFYRVELGNHNISRIVGEIYDFYLITAGPADSLKDGLIKFANWFKKEFWTDEPAVDLTLYDSREKEIVQKIAENLYAWVTSDLEVIDIQSIKKLKGLERRIAEYIAENESAGFTEIIEEFSEHPVSELFLATNKLVIGKYVTIALQRDRSEESTQNGG